MQKRSNRYHKYCARKDALFKLAYERGQLFSSSCSYRFLVSIVCATGILDIAGSCCLLSSCYVMVDALKLLEELGHIFPAYTAHTVKSILSISEAVNGIQLDGGMTLEDYISVMDTAILTYKIALILLLGVALYFFILSMVLFVGIYKKIPTCCFIWNVCQCAIMIIYVLLAFIVLFFKIFNPVQGHYVVMALAYWFYRVGTVVAVYRFQRKFLFISKLNGLAEWYDHMSE